MVTTVSNIISSAIGALQNTVVGVKNFISAGTESIYQSIQALFTPREKEVTQKVAQRPPVLIEEIIHLQRTLAQVEESEAVLNQAVQNIEERVPEKVSEHEVKAPQAKIAAPLEEPTKATAAATAKAPDLVTLPLSALTKLPPKTRSSYVNAYKSPRERTKDTNGVKEAYQHYFKEAFKHMNGPAEVQTARKQSEQALNKLLTLYNSTILSSTVQKEVKKALDQQLSELAMFDTKKYTRQGTKKQMVAAKLAALTKLNSEVETLTRKMQGN